MSHQPFYRESEESWAERQRRVTLLPGQEICDCGQIIELDERHQCANCGHQGCVHCMHWAEDTGDAELDGGLGLRGRRRNRMAPVPGPKRGSVPPALSGLDGQADPGRALEEGGVITCEV